MPPDPIMLRLLGQSALIAAQHAEHVCEMLKFEVAKTSQAEGGETLSRRSADMRRVAHVGREVSQSLLWLADQVEAQSQREGVADDA